MYNSNRRFVKDFSKISQSILNLITRVALGHILLFTKRKTPPNFFGGVFRFCIFRPIPKKLLLKSQLSQSASPKKIRREITKLSGMILYFG